MDLLQWLTAGAFFRCYLSPYCLFGVWAFRTSDAHLARPATSPDESQRLIAEAFVYINNVDVIAAFHTTLAGAEFGMRSSVVPLDYTLALSPLTAAGPRGRGNPSKHTKVACHIYLAQGAHCFDDCLRDVDGIRSRHASS